MFFVSRCKITVMSWYVSSAKNVSISAEVELTIQGLSLTNKPIEN